jgi:integrase
MAAGNVRRDFRRALALIPGIDPSEWTPRELRHSFRVGAVGCRRAVEEISRLVGHSGTTVTDLVYRHQLKPVIQTGATGIDQLFGRRSEGAQAPSALRCDR